MLLPFRRILKLGSFQYGMEGEGKDKIGTMLFLPHGMNIVLSDPISFREEMEASTTGGPSDLG